MFYQKFMAKERNSTVPAVSKSTAATVFGSRLPTGLKLPVSTVSQPTASQSTGSTDSRSPVPAVSESAAATVFRTLVVLLAVLTLLTSLQPMVFANKKQFSDVSEDYWAYADISSFAEQGVVDGYTDGTFKPEGSVTREEFCKLLTLTFYQEAATPLTQTFADVEPTRWSYPYIELCRDYMTSYASPFGGKPAFHPAQPAVREDIAVALVKMMGLSGSDLKDWNYAAKHFSDAYDISPELVVYVSLAAERGLIQGYPDGSFRPGSGITRAETVVMLNRCTKVAFADSEDSTIAQAPGAKPVLTFTSCPDTVDENFVTFEGTIQDNTYACALYINNERVDINETPEALTWKITYVDLEEGENRFEFVAVNAVGLRTSQTVIVNYIPKKPVLFVEETPDTTTESRITFKGTMSDPNNAYVYLNINGERVAETQGAQTHAWSKTYDLQEGDNTFIFELSNPIGDVVTEKRVVTYVNTMPELVFTEFSETSRLKNVTLRGVIQGDTRGCSLTVNGADVTVVSASEGGNIVWRYDAVLTEGENSFTFLLSRDGGGTYEVTKTIRFYADAPVLTISECPTESYSETVTLRGRIMDPNYALVLTINGEEVARTDTSGDTYWTYTATLREGANEFDFVLSSDSGMRAADRRVITFRPAAPVIDLYYCPETTSAEAVTVLGKVTGAVDLFLNDVPVPLDDDGAFRQEVPVEIGENLLHFTAVSSYGKTADVSRTVYRSE